MSAPLLTLPIMLPKLNFAPQEFSACLSLNNNIPSCVPWPGLCLRLCRCLCRAIVCLLCLLPAAVSPSVRPQARSRGLVMSVCLLFFHPLDDGSTHLDQEPVAATCAIPHTDDLAAQGSKRPLYCKSFFTLPPTHPHSSSSSSSSSSAPLPPLPAPPSAHDLPVPRHWSSVRVSSRRLASLPQVRGLIAQCTPPIRDRWAWADETQKQTCPYRDRTVLFCDCLFRFASSKPGPGSDAPAIARPNQAALRLVRSQPS